MNVIEIYVPMKVCIYMYELYNYFVFFRLKQLEAVLQKLPLVSVQWKIKNCNEKSSSFDREKGSSTSAQVSLRDQRWLPVRVSEECVVQVELNRYSLKQQWKVSM